MCLVYIPVHSLQERAGKSLGSVRSPFCFSDPTGVGLPCFGVFGMDGRKQTKDSEMNLSLSCYMCSSWLRHLDKNKLKKTGKDLKTDVSRASQQQQKTNKHYSQQQQKKMLSGITKESE